jgi:site-specific recombinase XerC
LKAGATHELAVLRPFLDYVRAEAGVAAALSRIAPSVASQIEQRYRDYLRTERGLTDRSVCVYLPLIRDFLTELEVKTGGDSMQTLDALIVKDFLLDRVGDRSSEYCRLLATAMRSLLRFLHLRGETIIDLSLCVPTVRRYRGATVQ